MSTHPTALAADRGWQLCRVSWSKPLIHSLKLIASSPVTATIWFHRLLCSMKVRPDPNLLSMYAVLRVKNFDDMSLRHAVIGLACTLAARDTSMSASITCAVRGRVSSDFFNLTIAVVLSELGPSLTFGWGAG